MTDSLCNTAKVNIVKISAADDESASVSTRKITDSVAREVSVTIRDMDEIVYETAASPLMLKELEAGYLYVRNRSASSSHLGTCAAMNPDKLMNAMKCMLDSSESFKLTGAMHCAALCRDDEIIYFAEDISRHNAIYKVIGACILSNRSHTSTGVGGDNPSNYCLCTSARTPASIIRLAIDAGITAVISRSAPTDAAIELALANNIALYGFASANRINLYT